MDNLIQDTQLREKIDLYTSKWKWIIFCLLFLSVIGVFYLRYTNHEYRVTATLQFQDESKNNQLPELANLQNSKLFGQGLNKIEDEIRILTSKTIIEKVITDLNLHTKYYTLGKINATEIFNDIPLQITFFENDSILKHKKGTLIVEITATESFKLIDSKTNSNHIINKLLSESKTYKFGEKISTLLGDIIITPNLNSKHLKIGSTIAIEQNSIEQLTDYYLKKIKVESSKTSSIINITLDDHINERAILIVDKLIEKYNDDVVDDKENIIKVTSDFISNRLNIVTEELLAVDLTAENLKRDNRLSDLAAQSSIFLQNEKENKAQYISTSNQIELIDYMSDYMADDTRTSDLLPANIGINDNGIQQLTKSYNELVLQRDRILRNSSEKNPTVINLNNQINALNENLNQSLSNLKSSAEITLNSINKENSRIKSQIYSAPKKERQFRDITRQQSIKESLYLYLLQKREETAIMLGMSTANAKIIDKAYSSKTPINPNPTVVTIAVLILGLLIPVLTIYISDLLNTKIHNRQDLKQVKNIPFIGDIPKSSNKKSKRLVTKIDYSPKAEAFRLVRTNIEFLLKGKKEKSAKTVFITSTKAQEGKSHTSINLASSISFSNKKVLLIETDIRVPKVDEYLNLNSKIGLTDYVSDTDLSVQDVTTLVEGNPNLNVIPSGTIPPNPSELLMSERVSHLFDEVKKKYDYIIVDTAAVGLVTDTLLLSDQADLFIYVVSAYNLDKRELHVAKTMFEEQRLPNMSILLNGTKKRSGYGYGYGYGSEKKSKKWFKKKA